MQVVVETPSYLRAAEVIFSEAEREDVVNMVAAEPECGVVMQGGRFSKGARRPPRHGKARRGARDLYPPQR
jgi:hypothetical protein